MKAAHYQMKSEENSPQNKMTGKLTAEWSGRETHRRMEWGGGNSPPNGVGGGKLTAELSKLMLLSVVIFHFFVTLQ